MQLLITNWNKYKRMQINIDKAKINKQVTDNLNKYYNYLHSKLVKFDEYEDLFNDTFLKLTNKYDPEKDFVDQFIYYFNYIKGAYFRDGKVDNYITTYIEDNLQEVSEIIDEEPVITGSVNEDTFLNNLTENINAIYKEAV